jgi:hypothetical protein
MSRQWDSNPQPSVYKTDALPLSYAGNNCINIIKDIRNNSKILILAHLLTFLEFYVLKTIKTDALNQCKARFRATPHRASLWCGVLLPLSYAGKKNLKSKF